MLEFVSGLLRTLIERTALTIPDTVGVSEGVGVLLAVGGTEVKVGVEVKVGNAVLDGRIVAVTGAVRLGIGCNVSVAGNSTTASSEGVLQATSIIIKVANSKKSFFMDKRIPNMSDYQVAILAEKCISDSVMPVIVSCVCPTFRARWEFRLKDRCYNSIDYKSENL